MNIRSVTKVKTPLQFKRSLSNKYIPFSFEKFKIWILEFQLSKRLYYSINIYHSFITAVLNITSDILMAKSLYFSKPSDTINHPLLLNIMVFIFRILN